MRKQRQDRTSKGIWLAALSAVLLTLAGWVAIGNDTHDVPDGLAATVDMTDDLRFTPSTVTVQVGATVTWRNTSQVMHTVTADPNLANDPSHVQLPQGAEAFNSGNIGPGDSYSRTFDVAGTYTYFCIPHEGQGMIGTVIVE